MHPKSRDLELDRLAQRIFPLARSIHMIASHLEPPRFLSPERGFRYERPELIHFCLLRAARIVSALNASVALARCGYSQEIAVLLRTMIEYTTQIDYMLAVFRKDRSLPEEAEKFLREYFNDDVRPRPPDKKAAKLIQRRVHEVVGAKLDSRATQSQKAEDRLSNVYLIFSNYVHGRYPECMDLYGGAPGRFHVNGQFGTPKDAENLEIIDSLITTASYCLIGLARRSGVAEHLKEDAHAP